VTDPTVDAILVTADNMLFAVGTGLHGSGDGGVTVARKTRSIGQLQKKWTLGQELR
jgi:hypothetical protein